MNLGEVGILLAVTIGVMALFLRRNSEARRQGYRLALHHAGMAQHTLDDALAKLREESEKERW